jgi:hypothetical protein
MSAASRGRFDPVNYVEGRKRRVLYEESVENPQREGEREREREGERMAIQRNEPL